MKLISLLGGAVALALTASAYAGEKADLILIHGRIITMDAKDSVAQAIAVTGGRIIAVGSDKQIQALATDGTQIIDLGGRAATPGLIDTHAHISEGGTDEVYDLILSDAPSVENIVARVAARAKGLKPGEWLSGSGWDEGKLGGKLPSAADLDKAAPDNPVFLLHTTGHYAAVNSAALKLAGITAQTPSPAAGTIDKDASGNPTGVLREDAAMALVRHLMPERSVEQIEAGILLEFDVLHSEGITAIKDPAIGPRDWEAYRALLTAGSLTERVCVLWAAGATLDSAKAALASLDDAPHAPKSLGDGRLISCGAKIFMDGSGGARTAWMSQDWNKGWDGHDDGNHGYPTTDPEIYRAMARLFHEKRYQIGTHAIGDKAVDWVVDTYAALEKQDPAKGLRHTIIHANLVTAHALDEMALLQRDWQIGYPESQAEFLWWIGDNYAGNYGPLRAPHVVPLKSFLTHHIEWGGGSDFPVTPVAARYGIWASVERETLKGTWGKQPFGTKEAVNIHDALRSYTRWAAPLLFLEKEAGSLEIGKRADIAVWDRDPYKVKPDQLKDMKCLMTLLDGEEVYRAEGAPVTSKK
jgi:predicted amidohydrolase YtcJ